MFKKLVISLFVAVALSSCGSHQDLAYFQEIVESGALDSNSGQLNTIQPGDVLTISVSSSTPELAIPYNLFSARSQIASSVSAANSSNRVISNVTYEGYTVDGEGNIQFPVLGKINVAGLTRAEIADKITKGICNDFYTIPAGKGNIAISGKNQLNLFNLNSFIFNGAPTREMARNRQYNKTLGGIIFACLVVIGIVLGLIFGLANNGKKTFEYDNMKITLTEDFAETDVNGWEFCFASKDATIFGRKETVKDYPLLENFSLNEYSKLVLSNTKIDSSVELKKHNDYYYFAYVSNNVGGKGDVMYYAIMFDAPDGFMIINFSCLAEKVEELAPQIFDWADSVRFK